MTRRIPTHIVCHEKTLAIECQSRFNRDGDVQPANLPTPMDDYLKRARAFAERHRDCRPLKAVRTQSLANAD